MRAIKLRAVKEDRKLKDVIADLLRKGLARAAVKPGTPQKRVKLPLIRCVHNAHPNHEMTPERVSDLLLEGEGRARSDTV